MTAPTADRRSMSEIAASLPDVTRDLLSGLSGFDLTPPPAPDDLTALHAYRRTLEHARVMTDFGDRAELDAEITTVDDDLRSRARSGGGSPDFLADAHKVIARAIRPGFGEWLDLTARAKGCTRPVRLSGRVDMINARTGEIVDRFDTANLPGGVLYKPCGTRRASLCPSCAETYRYDTYHLIAAGLRGGKGVPTTVTQHPAVFATFTAPSFGEVHSRIVKRHRSTCTRRTTGHCDCPPDPCHARRDMPRCPHGRALSCTARHPEGHRLLGRPMCLDCYDHAHQIVWNHHVPQLWSRTVQQLQRIAKRHGCIVRYAKVAEFQRRGVVHFHALFRLDDHDPDNPTAVTPPIGISADDLDAWITEAAHTIGLASPPHPARPQGWPILWGQQLDTRTVHRGLPGADLTEQHVAGYLAKYATKACEPAGLVAGRITPDTIEHYTTLGDPHLRALIAACWDLGRPPASRAPWMRPAPTEPTDPPAWNTRPALPHRANGPRPIPVRTPEMRAAGELGPRRTCPTCQQPTRLTLCPRCDRDHITTPAAADDTTTTAHPYGGLRRWAHMLGFGGHFSTKSRAYSTTLGALRAARRPGNRPSATAIDPADHRNQADDLTTETTLVIGDWSYIGSGWLTSGDAALATQAADAARSRRPRLDPHAS